MEAGDRSRLTALGARVHLYVRPAARQRFVELFRDVLGCKVIERYFGMEYPLVLVSFDDGSAFSVDFTESALEESTARPLEDKDALRGAWIEFRTHDAESVQKKLRDASIP